MGRYRWALLGLGALIVASLLISTRLAPASQTAHPNPSDGAGADAAAELIPDSDRPDAPDLVGIDAWLNSAPLQLSQLRGTVVLVDFWTFSCVNCTRTIPHLRTLYDTYHNRGFTIIGVHSPEFDFEKVVANVGDAVGRLGVSWPVAVDSEMRTWSAFGNRYWPAEYLIDQRGRIAYTHVGEGDYDVSAAAVAALLGTAPAPAQSGSPEASSVISPELYAGSDRGRLDAGEEYGAAGQVVAYPGGVPRDGNALRLAGPWIDRGQNLESAGEATVQLRFTARTLFIVAGPRVPKTARIAVRLDGAEVPVALRGPGWDTAGVGLSRTDLVQLLALPAVGTHVIELSVPSGIDLFTFTFG